MQEMTACSQRTLQACCGRTRSFPRGSQAAALTAAVSMAVDVCQCAIKLMA
jgi:hypothetical protein